MSTAAILGFISLSIWLYLFFARGRYWRIPLDHSPDGEPVSPFRIVAVIPARNEAGVVSRAISSLLQQRSTRLHIIMVDDGSADGTAEVARKTAADLGGNIRLEVISGEPLPPGWSGKLWAVKQGVEAAAKYSPDFLLLTDADIEHDPDNVSRLVHRAHADQLDLVSYMVQLQCNSIAEKLLIPPFIYFFLKLYPPSRIADSQSKVAGAAGGCMLIRPTALARAGGMEAIRGEIIDDCALASRVKQTGGKIRLSLAKTARCVRPYASFGEIGRMISRTAFNQLRHSILLLILCLAGLVLTYIMPIAVLFSHSSSARIFGAFALVLMLISYAPMVRFYRLNVLWTLALPLASIFYMGAAVRSAIMYWLGRGGYWKGRVQDRGATYA